MILNLICSVWRFLIYGIICCPLWQIIIIKINKRSHFVERSALILILKVGSTLALLGLKQILLSSFEFRHWKNFIRKIHGNDSHLCDFIVASVTCILVAKTLCFLIFKRNFVTIKAQINYYTIYCCCFKFCSLIFDIAWVSRMGCRRCISDRNGQSAQTSVLITANFSRPN